LSQYRFYYEHFIVPAKMRYREERLITRFPFAVTHTQPATWLMFFVPLGIVGLAAGGRAHWAMAAVFVLFVLLYMTFMFFAAHYLIVITPVGIFLALVGARQLERLVTGRLRNYLTCFLALVFFTTAIGCLPEISGLRDDPKVSLPMQSFNRELQRIERPAVVFFHCRPDNPQAWRHEQVFTIDAAWPDDSPVVRAHDLGSRNIELVRYYAQRQPERIYYRFQQESQQLTRLGTATQLLADPHRLLPPPPEALPATKPLTPPGKGLPDDPD
jgi:hypothetical protein